MNNWARSTARRKGKYKPTTREKYEVYIRGWIVVEDAWGEGCCLRNYTDKVVERTSLCAWCDEDVNMDCTANCVNLFNTARCKDPYPCQCKLSPTREMIDQHVKRLVTNEFGFENKGEYDPLKKRVSAKGWMEHITHTGTVIA